MKKVLIMTAHPDDAEIAMGGTILKLKNEGYKVINVILSIPNDSDIRMREAIQASDIGKYTVLFSNLSKNRQVEDIPLHTLIEEVDNYISECKPDIVFTHWIKDSHQDHRLISQAVRSSCRNQQFSLLEFEQINQNNVISANEFQPNSYFDITDYIDGKIMLIEAFQSQISDYKSHYIQKSKILSQWRGSQIYTQYAEAFRMIFTVIKH